MYMYECQYHYGQIGLKIDSVWLHLTTPTTLTSSYHLLLLDTRSVSVAGEWVD